MERELDRVKFQIIRLIRQLSNPDWRTVEIVYEFPPTSNEGHRSTQLFQKSNREKVRLVLKEDKALYQTLSDFVRNANQEGAYNRINFFADKKALNDAIINAEFDQSIENDFQKNLPQSLRGKAAAWYQLPPVEEKTEADPLDVWSAFGTVEEEVEIPYLHPFHANYPAWPGGDRYLKLLRTNWNTQIIFTAGLSNPANLSMEAYLETVDVVKDFSRSWQANLVYGIGRILPNVPDLVERLTKFTYLSVQIELAGAPDDWSLKTNNGNVGIFLGLPSKQLNQFKADFRPLSMKLLRPQETKFILEKGGQGRMLLADLFTRQGNATVSYLDRPSVIK